MAASRVGNVLRSAVLVVVVCFLPVSAGYASAGASRTKVGVMQYGSFESNGISCERDEIIKITSETLGFSSDPRRCEPDRLCSVSYTLAKWFCRGKRFCSGIPVERRPLHKRTCGTEFTNCLRVEYHCVKRKTSTD